MYTSRFERDTWDAIYSTKISENVGQNSMDRFGPAGKVSNKLVHLFSRSDRSEFWLNGSRPWTPAWSGLVRNQHQFCSRRIVLTPKSYFLRPETRHRPHQSSQYDAFLSQARNRCFTCLAKMRRITVTYWTTADFANRKTCSFIKLNDAFRKTLLQAAKKKPRN